MLMTTKRKMGPMELRRSVPRGRRREEEVRPIRLAGWCHGLSDNLSPIVYDSERHSSAELEDDDLDLLLENTGAKPRVAKPTKAKPKKLRRRRSFSAGSSRRSATSEDEEIPTQDLQHIFDDLPRKRKEAMMMDDDGDDMADFIEEDEGLGGDDEEAERARRKEKKRRLKNKQLGTKQGGEGGIDKA